MARIAFATPILPGKLEAWRRFNQESLGWRAAAHEASRRRLGISREFVWLQQATEGNMAIVYLEADKLEHVFEEMASSKEFYDVWFRQQMVEMYGLDLTQLSAGPPADLVFEWLTQ